MRPFECSLTPAGRLAVLEMVLSCGRRICLSRTENGDALQEEWRVGSGFRKEWCLLTRDGPETNWNARFGSDLKGTQVIERAFLEMHNQGFCEWIYPEGWPEVMAQQIDDGNAEKPPGDERAP